MASNAFLLGLVTAVPLLCSGCLDISEKGLELTPRVPYESSVQEVGQPLAWAGEPLDVRVERGFVEVVGDPDATHIVVTAHALTWARYRDVDSARQIHDAILGTASVSVSDGTVRVRCGVVDEDIGSAQSESTQCDLRVVVPAPAGATHQLKLTTGLGDAFLQRLTTTPQGRLELNVNGFVEGWDLHGNVFSQAGASDLEVTPLAGGSIEVISHIALAVGLNSGEGLHDAKHKTGTTLRLPGDFATQTLKLWSDDGSVTTPDFPDLTVAASARPGAAPASLVRATADWGHVTLLALQEFSSRSRTSALGTIVTKP